MQWIKLANLKHFANNCNVKVAINKKGCNNVAKIKDIAAKVAITLQNVAKRCEMEWIAETSKKANFISCKRIELQKLPKRQISWVAETSKKKANFK